MSVLELTQPVSMIRWPSIELFHNLRRSLAAVEQSPMLTYRAKIKLDGTNAAVQVFPNGRVIAQSRSQLITPEKDNMGFAQWLDQAKEAFADCAQPMHMTFFGEWCGKGIQRRTAISEIDRKIFVVFAIQFDGIQQGIAHLEIAPERIAAVLPEHPDVYVLPFYQGPITLDFSDENRLKEAIALINQSVKTVEHTDPWVKETFGIQGLGEGLVFYPDIDSFVERLDYNDLLFKAKGEKHQVVKNKKPVQLDPELVKSIDEFVTLFITPNRLEQGLNQGCNGMLEMSQIGNFLKWIAMDVQKESLAELEAAQLTWRNVSKAVNTTAKNWYITQVKSI